uniref:Uncharacterized protein n=1 Tax=Arundo donax TaxID=35708 RepID=A0A0A9ADR3_ARUDO
MRRRLFRDGACSPRNWITPSSAAYSAQNASHCPFARRMAACAIP